MNKYNLLEKILTNTASEEELKQFQEWINASSANKEEFEHIKKAWGKMAEAFSTKNFDTSAAKYKVKQQVATVIAAQKQKHLLTIKRVAFAASFALIIALGFLVYLQTARFSDSHKEYTAGNEVTEIILSDSTHVWLNAHSTLKTGKQFGYKQRKVVLMGEAFFDVKRDENKPFEILIANTKTRVLGTSFNLYHDSISGNVQLTVASGTVEFSHNSLSSNLILVTKNESATYFNKNHQLGASKEMNPNYLSWKTGKLVFDDTPMEQVCHDISKFYGTTVESFLNDRTILTGTFDHESFHDVLAAIQISLNVQIIEVDGIYQLQNLPLKSNP